MKIVYGKSALRDLELIRAYIARDNPNAARRVVERIEQVAGRLEIFPCVQSDAVRIVAVFHTARNRQF
jgi:plasmid stabilization system protein ParE